MRLVVVCLLSLSIVLGQAHAEDVAQLESFYFEIEDIKQTVFDDPIKGRERLLVYEDAVTSFPSEAALAYYNQLILSYAYAQEYTKAYTLASRIEKDYYQQTSSKEYAMLLLNKAYSVDSIEKMSEDDLMEAYEYGMDTNDPEVMYMASMVLGEYHSMRDNIIQAHGHVMDALGFAEEMKGEEGEYAQAGTYFMLASIGRQMERHNEVLDYGMKAASVYRKMGDIASLVAVKSLTSYALIKQKKFKDAKEEIEGTLIEISQNDLDYLKFTPLFLLALVEYETEHYDDAQRILDDIRESAVEKGMLSETIFYHNLYLRVLVKIGELEKANLYLTKYIGHPDKVMGVDENTEMLYGKVESVESYAMLLESEESYADAIEAWKLFINVRVMHLERKRSAAIQEYLVKHRVALALKESERLERETNEKKLQLTVMKKELYNNELWLWFGLLIGILVVGIIINQNLIRKRLKKIVDTDTLTGVSNRHALMEYGKRIFEKQESDTGSIVMLDIDKFKKINDTYGHDTGDAVLTAFAEAVSGVIRENDKFGRYGGEEFIAILPKSDHDEAIEIANRIIEAVRDYDWSALGLETTVTASVGVSSKKHWDQGLSDLLKEADMAMYKVKHSTRDGVMHFSDMKMNQRNVR